MSYDKQRDLIRSLSNCDECPLSKGAYFLPVPMEGSPDAEIVFVGDAPGKEDVPAKRPFIGMDGQILRALTRTNRKVAYMMVVACRPPNDRDPTANEIACCAGYREHCLSQHPNANFVALGRIALAELGVQEKLSNVDGSWVEAPDGRKVLASYHPAFALRQPTAARSFAFTMQRALDREPRLLAPAKAEYKVGIPDRLALGYVSLDLETTGLSFLKDRIRCVVICDSSEYSWIVPESLVYTPRFRSWLLDLFNSPKHTIVGANFKFDMRFILHHLKIDHPQEWLDTQLTHYTINEEGLAGAQAWGDKDEKSKGHGLKILLRRWLGWADYKKKWDWATVTPESLYPYAAIDGVGTRTLIQRMLKDLDERGHRLLRDLLIPASEELAHLEIKGMPFDVARAEREHAKFEAERVALIAEMKAILVAQGAIDALQEIDFTEEAKRETYVNAKGKRVKKKAFKPGGAHQICSILYNLFGLPPQYSAKTGNLTSDKTAVKYLYEYHAKTPEIARFLELLFEFRKNQKMDSTNIVGKLKRVIDGRLYTELSLTSTLTGRLSGPEQQIPRTSSRNPLTRKTVNVGKVIKDLFIATPCADEAGEWVLLQADWSQVELRVMARLAMALGMIAAFARDEDIHTASVVEMLSQAGQDYYALSKAEQKELRSAIGKRINFGVGYGMTAHTVANDIWSEMTVEERLALPKNAQGVSEAAWNGLPEEKRLELGFKFVLRRATEMFDLWFKARPEVKAYQERVVAEAFKTGKMSTPFGRQRKLTFIPKDERARGELRNHCLNWAIQGAASDTNLLSFVRISKTLRREGWRSYPILLVHDSILFVAHRSEVERLIPLCNDTMLGVADEIWGREVKFKVDFEVGERWGSLVKTKFIHNQLHEGHEVKIGKEEKTVWTKFVS